MSPRPTTYDDQLRQRLVDEAAIAIAEHGPENISLRQIAKAAGTSTNAIYTLHGDKAGLVLNALFGALIRFTEDQEAVPVTDNARDDLMALGHAYRNWALNQPVLFQVMFGKFVRGGPGVSTFEESQPGHPLVSAVRRAVEQGHFRPCDPIQVALSMWAHVHGFVLLEIDHWRNIDLADRDTFFDLHMRTAHPFWFPEAGQERGDVRNGGSGVARTG